MCIFFSFCNKDPSPEKFNLILAFNRETVLDRPAKAACWQDGFLGGRDVPSGGSSWLGINKWGKLALLTDIYTGGVTHEEARPRKFVNNFLSGNHDASQYLEQVKEEVESNIFNPFNLCLFQRGSDDNYETHYLYRGLYASYGPRTIDDEFFGMSNHPHNRPFKKTTHGIQSFKSIVERHNNINQKNELLSELRDLMCNETRHFPDSEVSNLALEAGSNVDLCKYKGRYCYSIFVKNLGDTDNCGTSAQTFVLADYLGRVTFVERSRQGRDEHGQVQWSEKKHNFEVKQ